MNVPWRHRWSSPLRIGVLALALAPTMAAAQRSGEAQEDGANDQVTALRMLPGDSTRIELDGLLSEPIWSSADPIRGFRQREPDAADPATEDTEVRFVYDEGTLYIGVLARDSDPDAIVARILQRDKLMEAEDFERGLRFAGDDAVAILFDPFHDHRNGVVFGTNPNGAEFEALVTDEGSEVNIDWRGVWQVASARVPEGWSAEFAIPWRTLRYPDAVPDQPWGVNVFRVIRRKNEETLWRSWQREGGGLHRVSRAGHLGGLEELPRARLNFEAKPFALLGARQEVDGGPSLEGSHDEKIGFDIKAEVRPGLLLDLTVNTDFAQVEVDDEQVNLTRFSLFFPEKRDFFLENAGIFEFGKAGNGFEPPTYQMLFTRRIGIHDDGEVPILGGARLTGRVGGQTVGFLSVLTDEAFGTPRETFTVARVKRDIGESAYLGGMVADRRHRDAWSTNVGLDGQFTIGEAWTWDLYAARSLSQGNAGDGYSYRVAYSWFGDEWGSFFEHYVVSPDMEAEAGFLLRDDLRWTELFTSKTWRPNDFLGLREISSWGGGRYGSRVSDGSLQDWVGGIAFSPSWHSGDEVTVFLNASETIVDESFELSDSVDVPVGRYRNDHVGWFANTSRNRSVFAETSGMISAFFGGSLVSVGGTVTAAPSAQLSFSVGHTRNRVEVPGGDFTADISSARVTLALSTRLSTNALVQYNSLDRSVSANVRFNFIHRPGSDLFVVFTENRGDDDRLWSVQQRGLAMKVTYLLRM